MIIYDVTKGDYVPERFHGQVVKWYNDEDRFFVILDNSELDTVNKYFKFDPYTISECVNFDENIRFDSYRGYDFISLIYFYKEGSKMIFSEINLFIGKNYIIFVMPKDLKVKGGFINFIKQDGGNETFELTGLTRIYYRIFHKILTDLSVAMEEFEDDIRHKELKITEKAHKEDLYDIIKMKTVAAKIKKMLRPMLYIGDQFMINENGFIQPDKMKYFKNIDIRMNKLYDFAVGIYESAEQLMFAYDSKVNMQTNETVTKLTVITVCIAPLTVITGIYGMNFVYMPELQMRYFYPATLIAMIAIVIGIFVYFKRKHFF